KDLRDIADHGCTYVVHCYTETDLAYYGETMRDVADATREAGLEVWFDPWGVAGIFSGETSRAFRSTTRRPGKCSRTGGGSAPRVRTIPTPASSCGSGSTPVRQPEARCCSGMSPTFTLPSCGETSRVRGPAAASSALASSTIVIGTQCRPNLRRRSAPFASRR